MAEFPEPKESFKYRLHFQPSYNWSVLQVSLGLDLLGVAPIMADVFHPPSNFAGTRYRVARSMPTPDPEFLRGFERFVASQLVDLPSIPVGADVSLATCLEGAPYSMARKVQLWNVAQELGEASLQPEHVVNLGFGKMQTDMDFKFNRGIHSRHDAFKVFSAPYFRLAESQVYSHYHSFIKHVPVCERPSYIISVCGAGPRYYATDFTSYEAAFTGSIMQASELQLYRKLFANYPAVSDQICEAISGNNVCKFRDYSFSVDACRMSGDMCTSLGNGFTNLMVFRYIVASKGGVCDGVVEGDDGLFASTVEVTKEDYTKLGFDVKILEHSSLLTASFCGLVCTDELTSMTEPRKVLVNFGWSHSPLAKGNARVLRKLLRAKALSLCYEQPRCPLLTALAMRALQLTDGEEPIFDRGYWADQLNRETLYFSERTQAAVKAGITNSMRCQFASLYGVPVDVQLSFEEYISNIGLDEQIDHPIVDLLFPPSHPCRYYSQHYVSSWDDNFSKELARP